MSLQLNRESLRKLTHESLEIRLRTLEQVEAKLQRAFTHNEEINFKPGELCKQLIRWFGFKPLQEAEKVLRLMLLILNSSYGERAVKQLGVERFQTEMGKVQQIMDGSKIESQLAESIQLILRNEKDQDEVEDIIEILDNINASEEDTDRTSNGMPSNSSNEYLATDYEVPWTKATIADYNTMKIVADTLASPESTSLERQNALQHLQVIMSDYPVEYMLQSPNIFVKLLDILERAEDLNCPLDDIADTLVIYLKLLKKQLQVRYKCQSYVGTTSASVVQPRTQLKLEMAMQLLLQKCLKVLHERLRTQCYEIISIFETIFMVKDIQVMQCLSTNNDCLIMLHRMRESLQEALEHSEQFTLQRVKYLLVVFLLEDFITNNAKLGEFANAELLEPLLKDYALKVNYPQRYENLKRLMFQVSPKLKSKHEVLVKYEASLSVAISLLRSPEQMQKVDIIENGHNICLTLELLKSLQLLQHLLDAIVECNPVYQGNLILKTQASDLLLKLLQLQDDTLRSSVYAKLSHIVKKHFGCLMSGSAFCSGATNAALLEAHIIGVPWSTQLLLQLVNESFETSDISIRQNCEDILALLLKSQHLLGTHWLSFLDILEPVLPLIQCCTFSSKIMEALLKIYDPDAANVNFLTMLQGNVGFLFHRDMKMRAEALTRIFYIMNQVDPQAHYVPNILQISDLIPNDICFLSAPRDYQNIFSISENCVELSTLHSLLDLLDSQDVEPAVRKTTLLQLNVLCRSWEVSTSFCDQGAYFLILRTLESSLQTGSHANYSDAAIPAISILCKLIFNDAQLRQQLAQKENFYILLLRALFLYQNDIQVREDATVCLFQLIFASYIVVVSNTAVEVPKILCNIQLPVKCDLKSFWGATHSVNELRSVFLDRIEDTAYLRYLIAENFCGDLRETDCSRNKRLEPAQLELYCSSLHPTSFDYRLIKATQYLVNLRRYLKGISNATDYKAFLSFTKVVKIQLLVKKFDTGELPEDIGAEIFKLSSKYLQLSPGNEKDFLVYENLLDLCILCIKLDITPVIVSVLHTLEMDFQHSFIVLLGNFEIPLRLFHKLCILFTHLLQSKCCRNEAALADSSAFYSNLFDYLFELASQLFKSRNLQRVRGILSLTRLLSYYKLEAPDKLLYYYCKRFINLSINLKSYTQTGAQWQRDCLQITSQLNKQMQHPQQLFYLKAHVLKYLSGLCGHSDVRVRTLAWCVLAKYRECVCEGTTGYKQITDALSHLPGGFVACCLSTFLHNNEVLLVRYLAGSLFVELLGTCLNFEAALMLLMQHAFFKQVGDTLSACVVEPQFPKHFNFEQANPNLITCEIVSCYCRILNKMLKLNIAFCDELCEKPLMYKLYEVMKLVPVHYTEAYYAMCADICHLYAVLYSRRYSFLQRTLCRDRLWITIFYQLLEQPISADESLVHLLQLLLVISKDKTGYEEICDKISHHPGIIVKLFINALRITRIGTPLQRTVLAVLSFLLIKSQPEHKCEFKNFAGILDEPIQVAHAPVQVASKEVERNEENIQNIANIRRNAVEDNKSLKALKECASTQNASTEPQSSIVQPSAAASFIFIEVFRLYSHLHSIKTCKFDTVPSATKIQVCETLAILLKLSPRVQETATNMKLLDKILRTFRTFFDECNIACTTFVRRYGEGRKLTIIKNFQLHLNIVLNWFSAPTANLRSELLVVDLTKVLIQIWPWLTHSGELKLLVLRICAFLSDRSLAVCQHFSMVQSGQSTSLLQLVIKIILFETNTVKASRSENFPVVENGLRIVMNCCACIEGRVILVKAHVLDVFDNMHPFNEKMPKIKQEILHTWLQFWELFSRYSEGAQVRNLSTLCFVINRSQPRSATRLFSLKILRNMCFQFNNRFTFMASVDFIHTVNEIITQPIGMSQDYSFEEHFLVSVSIWKLISGGVKFISMLRGTKLAKKFHILREQLKNAKDEDPCEIQERPFAANLIVVLDFILGIIA